MQGVEKDKELIIDATNKGILVDPKIVTTAIKTKILSSAGKKFIVEGYPRCKAELDAWADSCSDQCFYDTVIYVDSPLETMKANLSANEKTAPLSNALLSTFVSSTLPLFDLFSRTNKLRVISSAASAVTTVASIARAIKSEQCSQRVGPGSLGLLVICWSN